MNAEIIAVGSEMLTPARVDTNSLYLTDQLNALGIEVVAKHVIGDDRERLAEAVRHAIASVDIVIVTGGLGPTEDDVTRDAVAEALGVKQSLNEEVLAAIADRFARIRRKMSDNNRRQAMVLDGAEVLDNPHGSAPGLLLARNSKIVTLLPGPPRELKPMVESHVIPRLRAIVPPMAIAVRHYRIAGMGESDLDALIAPVYTKYTNPITTVLAKAGDLDVILRARCGTSAEAEALCEELGLQIEQLLSDRIYSKRGESLEAEIGARLIARGETVAVAESMTSGMVAARLTDIAGSSAWFKGGFLVYHRDLKQKLIGDFDGDPVSENVATRLAMAAREQSGATWGLSVTGYAGPDGAEPGLVWIGIANTETASAREFHFFRDRALNRALAAQTALDMLRKRIQ